MKIEAARAPVLTPNKRKGHSELKAMITHRTVNEWTAAHMKTAGKPSRDWAEVRLEMRRMQSFTVPDTTFDARPTC